MSTDREALAALYAMVEDVLKELGTEEALKQFREKMVDFNPNDSETCKLWIELMRGVSELKNQGVEEAAAAIAELEKIMAARGAAGGDADA